MRVIRKIKIEIVKQSDIYEELIYAFQSRGDINVLVRKNDQYFWKQLSATNLVWHQMYATIEAAIEGVLNLREYKLEESPIMEFDNLTEFLKWSLDCCQNK